jgi:hypothetical protein
MKVHITKIGVLKPSTKKDGTAITSRAGKQLFDVGIQTAEFGDVWINNKFMPFHPERWEGTVQELEIYDEDFNGKTYKKFKLPPQNQTSQAAPEPTQPAQGWGKVELSIANLHRKVDSIIDHLSGDRRLDATSDGSPMPNFDIDDEVKHFETLASQNAKA